jgi:hypothetical protein
LSVLIELKPIPTALTSYKTSALKTILLAWLIAGTLDILAAIAVYDLLLHKTTAIKILQSIARGVFGPTAYQGGNEMAFYGLCLHYLIAFIFTLFYFIIFPYLPFLKRNSIISGLAYGVFVWSVMNLSVLPLLGLAKIPHKWDSIARGMLILMLCVGLPIAVIVNRYYARKKLPTTA